MKPSHKFPSMFDRYRFASRLRVLFIIVALLMIVSAEAISSDGLPFDTAVVELTQKDLERVYDGKVEAVNQATISAQTSGRIAEVFFDVNDYVQLGEPIVRFTDIEQSSALNQAEAALVEARAHAKQAGETFNRTSGLFESHTASRQEYDQALATRDAARARVRAASASVENAKQQLEYTLVRAPYDGIVTERHVELGEAVSVGQPLMSGLSLNELRVVVSLPQQVAAKVRQYDEAFILTGQGRVKAEKITIFPFAHAASNTFTVRINMPPGQFALFPGMFVKVALVIGSSERLLVPSSAVFRRSEVTAVYVVSNDEKLRLRQVRAGREFTDLTEILAGLEEGEQVALDPVRAGIYIKTQVVTTDEH